MKVYDNMDPLQRDLMIRTSVAASSSIEGYYKAADKLMKGQLRESVEAYKQPVDSKTKATTV